MSMRSHFESSVKAFDHPFHRFMLAHGRDYAIGPQTFAGPRQEAGECFMNASHLALEDTSLTYVEGVVAVYGVPVQHAWCADADGVVIDPTLGPAITDQSYTRIGDYFGVPFRTDYLLKASMVNGYYGLFGFRADKTFPKLLELGLEAGQHWLLHNKINPARRRRKSNRS